MGAKKCFPVLIVYEYYLIARLQSSDILYEGSRKDEA